MRVQKSLIGVLAVAIGLIAGCSKDDPKRFRVSGTVTYNNGQAMPFGEVVFTPEGANEGTQGIAYIHDGKFDTSQVDGKGYSGGPTTVRVLGLTGQNGKVICEYEYNVDISRGEATLDIVVPEKEIKKGPSKEF